MASCYAGRSGLKISHDILGDSPYVYHRRSRLRLVGGGQSVVLDGAANLLDQALVQQRLFQNLAYACGRGPRHDAVVDATGNEDDGRGDLAAAQTTGQIDAVHVRHPVVDHKAVDAGRTDRVQQRRAIAEGSNLKAVGFKKESQRTEHIGVVVDHVDR